MLKNVFSFLFRWQPLSPLATYIFKWKNKTKNKRFFSQLLLEIDLNAQHCQKGQSSPLDKIYYCICPSTHMSPVCMSTYLSACLSVLPFVRLPVCPLVYLSIMSVHPTVCQSVCQSICPPVHLSTCATFLSGKIKKKDFFLNSY